MQTNEMESWTKSGISKTGFLLANGTEIGKVGNLGLK